ncbi:hypothetical protein GCM10029978_017220 [Actinoallomurus acanthiterrae]
MRRFVVAGTLGVAGVLASGVPAHAASADHASLRVQRAACWQKVSTRISIKKAGKKWRDVKAQVWVSDPKLCKGKTITIWLEYRRTASGTWYKAQKPIKVKVAGSRKLYEAGASAYAFPCGQYVHTAYKLDGTTWVGKDYKICKGN